MTPVRLAPVGWPKLMSLSEFETLPRWGAILKAIDSIEGDLRRLR